MFGIWCRVWGGPTGSRASWLKSGDQRVEFSTLSEAQTEALRLERLRNGNPHRIATFSYKAVALIKCHNNTTISP